MREINYQLAAETAFFKHYITNVYPGGVCSYVSDTFDFWSVISKVALNAKEEILARTPNEIGLAKVVFRPDSGDPADILCGVSIGTIDDEIDVEDFEDYLRDMFMDDVELELGESLDDTIYFRHNGILYKATASIWANSYEGRYEIESIKYKPCVLSAKGKGAVETLWDIFGGTITETGHKLLNQRVGLIYGDSITLERALDILKRLDDKGFASANVVFGIGSYTYQHVTRDTYGFAVKSTWGQINGVAQEIFKDPKTDNGIKKSAKGLLRVIRTSTGFVLKDQLSQDEYDIMESEDAMKRVFYNGVITKETNLEEIRSIVNKNLTLP